MPGLGERLALPVPVAGLGRPALRTPQRMALGGQPRAFLLPAPVTTFVPMALESVGLCRCPLWAPPAPDPSR
jgi:hypothetical protein